MCINEEELYGNHRHVICSATLVGLLSNVSSHSCVYTYRKYCILLILYKARSCSTKLLTLEGRHKVFIGKQGKESCDSIYLFMCGKLGFMMGIYN